MQIIYLLKEDMQILPVPDLHTQWLGFISPSGITITPSPPGTKQPALGIFQTVYGRVSLMNSLNCLGEGWAKTHFDCGYSAEFGGSGGGHTKKRLRALFL